jgi:hypothetical protein
MIDPCLQAVTFKQLQVMGRPEFFLKALVTALKLLRQSFDAVSWLPFSSGDRLSTAAAMRDIVSLGIMLLSKPSDCFAPAPQLTHPTLWFASEATCSHANNDLIKSHREWCAVEGGRWTKDVGNRSSKLSACWLNASLCKLGKLSQAL